MASEQVMPKDGSSRSHLLGAALWMTGAIVSFTSMAVAGRVVSSELDTFELMMYRSFIGILIVLAAGWKTGGLGQISGRNLHLHFIRNVSHFAGQNLWFFALTAIPLAQVFALEFTSPIWVIVLAPLLLGERLTPARALTALIGFAGILIVARPDLGNLNVGVITAALAAVGFAGSAIFTKILTRRDTILCILFYLTTMQAVFGLAIAGFDGDIARPSLQITPWVVLIGFAGLVAHFCLTKALSIAPATVVMPLDFVRLPVIAVIGMAMYGERLDGFVFLGAGIIFLANYLNILTETRK